MKRQQNGTWILSDHELFNVIMIIDEYKSILRDYHLLDVPTIGTNEKANMLHTGFIKIMLKNKQG